MKISTTPLSTKKKFSPSSPCRIIMSPSACVIRNMVFLIAFICCSSRWLKNIFPIKISLILAISDSLFSFTSWRSESHSSSLSFSAQIDSRRFFGRGLLSLLSDRTDSSSSDSLSSSSSSSEVAMTRLMGVSFSKRFTMLPVSLGYLSRRKFTMKSIGHCGFFREKEKLRISFESFEFYESTQIYDGMDAHLRKDSFHNCYKKGVEFLLIEILLKLLLVFAGRHVSVMLRR